MVTGQSFRGAVTVSLTPGTGHRPVTLVTGGPALAFIARGTAIVGQFEGFGIGVGHFGLVRAHHPYRLPESAGVLLRGCPSTVDLSDPDRTRRLLPPGRYTLYTLIEDDGPGPNGYLLSEPHPLTVTARPAS